MNEPDRQHRHATGQVLQVAAELAREGDQRRAHKLLAAVDEAQLAYHGTRPPHVVAPAPRTICLRCGAPYEETHG